MHCSHLFLTWYRLKQTDCPSSLFTASSSLPITFLDFGLNPFFFIGNHLIRVKQTWELLFFDNICVALTIIGSPRLAN